MNIIVMDRLNDDKNIGKYYKINTTKIGHPKIKYEKHLPIADFYECFFIGSLYYIFNDKWEQGLLMEFHNVKYPLMKYNNKNEKWRIHMSNIISFDYITDEQYEVLMNQINEISNNYKKLLK